MARFRDRQQKGGGQGTRGGERAVRLPRGQFQFGVTTTFWTWRLVTGSHSVDAFHVTAPDTSHWLHRNISWYMYFPFREEQGQGQAGLLVPRLHPRPSALEPTQLGRLLQEGLCLLCGNPGGQGHMSSTGLVTLTHEGVSSPQEDLRKSSIFWGSETLPSNGVPEQITDPPRRTMGLRPDKPTLRGKYRKSKTHFIQLSYQT